MPLIGWGAALLALAGCHRAPTIMQQPPPTVTVARPVQREMVDAAFFTGRTAGSEFVEERARVSGYLAKVNFKPGNFIKQGDLLFEIDDRPYQAALEQAQGELERVKARLNRTNLDLERGESLISRKVITKEEYDRLVADQAEATAVVQSSAAAVKLAELNLEWTKVHAPISGLVSREKITAGNLVVADQTLLTTIVRYDPIYVYFDVDEHTVLQIQRLIREGKFETARKGRQPIRMGLSDDEGYPLEGNINFVENQLDRASGTIEVRAQFANPLLPNDSLRISAGLFARIRMDLGPPYQALLVSERSLLSDQDKKYVYIVNKEGVVQRRDVKLGQLRDGYRVISSGLEPTDRVITNGLHSVRLGVAVQAIEETLPGPSADEPEPNATPAATGPGEKTAPPAEAPAATPAPAEPDSSGSTPESDTAPPTAPAGPTVPVAPAENRQPG